MQERLNYKIPPRPETQLEQKHTDDDVKAYYEYQPKDNDFVESEKVKISKRASMTLYKTRCDDTSRQV